MRVYEFKDGPDDPYILKGSCGLTYTLIRSSPSLEANFSLSPRTTLLSSSSTSSCFSPFSPQLTHFPQIAIFNVLFISLASYMFLKFLFSLFPSIHRYLPSPSSGGNRPNFWPGGGGGGGPGFNGGQPPPPPYSAKPQTSPSRSESWKPGFWSGLAAGAAANHLLRPSTSTSMRESRYGGWGGGNLREWERDDDRGIGGSRGGGMTRSTGFGGTRNR